ncbi:MAG: gluconate transporter [Lunatimonas sp.]|uniref:GntP family permease n=1 Tax=Lunatimonas sp. TaxID=2060141 RepID=UPI00263A71F2|nr:SLC13 family permease [Lunatimonas sp.]MCC5936920.1 gluconate transporter [Lunatimonas sp.]
MDLIVHSVYWPFFLLLSSVLLVILLIGKLKVHPFFALMLASLYVGMFTPGLSLLPGQNWINTALELPMIEFGVMAGKIAWVIALAAIIGAAMLESRAAERIVNDLLRYLGESRAAFALLLCGFILSIPVFFDTVFFLLIPLGIALARKTGKDYVWYVLVIGGGAVINHSIVPPTPGPLIMAETLSLDLGLVILAGLIAGIVPAALVWIVGKKINERLPLPIRIQINKETKVSTLPGIVLSLSPIVLPVGLIAFSSVVSVLVEEVPAWVAFLGNKNTAMALGAVVAVYLWARQQGLSRSQLWQKVNKPLEIGGMIILITSAGGAYGAMIGHTGIGEVIKLLAEDFHIHYIPLAWLIAAIFKTAQGSGTVAMIASSSIMAGIMQAGPVMDFHPIYLLLAMGFGSVFLSWMNDSAFWVVARMSGFSEKETLKTWTFLLAVIGIVGLLQVMLVAWLFPLF